MAVIHRNRHPSFWLPKRAPVDPFQIDWSHPLARGLIGCYLPGNSFQDVCGVLPPLVPLLASSSAFTTTPEGVAGWANASSGGWQTTSIFDAITRAGMGSAGTLHWRGLLTSSAAAPTGYSLISIRSTTAANFALDTNVNLNSFYGLIDSTGLDVETGIITIPTNTPTSATFTYQQGVTNGVIFYVGKDVADTNTLSSPAPYQSDSLFRLAARGSSDPAGCASMMALIYARSLSADEVAYLNDYPYCFLKPQAPKPRATASTGTPLAGSGRGVGRSSGRSTSTIATAVAATGRTGSRATSSSSPTATTPTGTPQQIILTSGTSWTVPSDWNNSNNTIEAIGGGGGAANGILGMGAGGGAYSKISNLSLTTGAAITISIGAAGVGGASSASANNGTAGGDTWFNGTSLATSSVGAHGGGAGTTSAGAGGSTTGGIGTTKFAGGAGGAYLGGSAGGGGGAAGPNGAGGAGGDGDNNQAGAGGGGNGGGSAGSGGSVGSSTGHAGGNNFSGTGGGTGTTGAGGAGTNGGGGAGGFNGAGGAGGAGIEWTSAGSGGGGGAGGNFSAGTAAQVAGGNAGNYGGAGGAAGYNASVGGKGGNGAQGIIVISYTTASSTLSASGRGGALSKARATGPSLLGQGRASSKASAAPTATLSATVAGRLRGKASARASAPSVSIVSSGRIGASADATAAASALTGQPGQGIATASGRTVAVSAVLGAPARGTASGRARATFTTAALRSARGSAVGVGGSNLLGFVLPGLAGKAVAEARARASVTASLLAAARAFARASGKGPVPIQGWDPTHKNTNILLSGINNVTASASTSGDKSVFGVEGVSGGKYYWEIQLGISVTTTNSAYGIGSATSGVNTWIGSAAETLGWFGNGSVYNGGGVQATWGTYGSNGVLCFALDVDNKLIWGRSGGGNWSNSSFADPGNGLGGVSVSGMVSPVVPAANIYANGETATGKFAPSTWLYSPPNGFAPFDPVSAISSSGRITAKASSRAPVSATTGIASRSGAAGKGRAAALFAQFARSSGSAFGRGSPTGSINTSALTLGRAAAQVAVTETASVATRTVSLAAARALVATSSIDAGRGAARSTSRATASVGASIAAAARGSAGSSARSATPSFTASVRSIAAAVAKGPGAGGIAVPLAARGFASAESRASVLAGLSASTRTAATGSGLSAPTVALSVTSLARLSARSYGRAAFLPLASVRSQTSSVAHGRVTLAIAITPLAIGRAAMMARVPTEQAALVQGRGLSIASSLVAPDRGATARGAGHAAGMSGLPAFSTSVRGRAKSKGSGFDRRLFISSDCFARGFTVSSGRVFPHEVIGSFSVTTARATGSSEPLVILTTPAIARSSGASMRSSATPTIAAAIPASSVAVGVAHGRAGILVRVLTVARGAAAVHGSASFQALVLVSGKARGSAETRGVADAASMFALSRTMGLSSGRALVTVTDRHGIAKSVSSGRALVTMASSLIVATKRVVTVLPDVRKFVIPRR